MRHPPIQQVMVNLDHRTYEEFRDVVAHQFIDPDAGKNWYQKAILKRIKKWLKKHSIPYHEKVMKVKTFVIDTEKVQDLIMQVSHSYEMRTGAPATMAVIGLEQMNKLKIHVHETMTMFVDLTIEYGNRHGIFYRGLRLVLDPTIKSGIVCLGQRELNP